jgi:hypothetical protein
MRIRNLTISACILTGMFASMVHVSAAGPNELSDAEKAAGWKLLFDGKTTKGWRMFKSQSFPDNGWVVEDGWLRCVGKGGGNKGGGEIITDAEFDDFELTWDWKLSPSGNSGVKYFVIESRNEALGHEYQMIDDERAPGVDNGNPKQLTAAFYAVLAPVHPPIKPAGEINTSRIVVKGNHVEHWLNGAKVLEYECGSPTVKAGVAGSKFKNKPGFGNKVRGHILLQDHKSPVWFRNVKIRDLSAS